MYVALKVAVVREAQGGRKVGGSVRWVGGYGYRRTESMDDDEDGDGIR